MGERQPPVIRDEADDDAPFIRALLDAAFASTIEGDIVDALRIACPQQTSLIALRDDLLVGHILFTPGIIETGSGRIEGAALAPMAVAPAHQRSGIGSALARAGIERLRQSHCPFVLVVGHPDYYPKFGFVPGSRYGVRCQWDTVPDEAFMILVLDPVIGERLAGRAHFRPEFDTSV